MRNTSDTSSSERVNNTILSPLEGKILVLLAMRVPQWVSPNVLTLVGFLGAVVAFLGYWLSSFREGFLWLASFGWICNWYGDSLDGTVARYRRREKPKYGFYIDHNIDAFGVILIGIGLGLSPYVRFDIALFVVIAYLLLNIQIYTYACATKILRISYGKVGATEFRVLAILTNVVLYFVHFPRAKMLHLELSLFDLVALVLAGIMLIAFGFAVLLNSVELRRSEN